jgi:hypothetical protein
MVIPSTKQSYASLDLSNWCMRDYSLIICFYLLAITTQGAQQFGLYNVGGTLLAFAAARSTERQADKSWTLAYGGEAKSAAGEKCAEASTYAEIVARRKQCRSEVLAGPLLQSRD